MPLSLTFPATSENYTIIGRLSNDNNLAAIRATSFSLRKASDGSLVSRSVTIGSATRADDGSYYWDITVTNNDSYDGLVYVQIAAFSFWDSVASTVVPRSALDSNQFQYNTMAVPAPAAPSNFSGSATDTTIRFTWDTTPGKTYEIRQGSNAWADATSPHQATGLSPSTAYTYEVREKASGSTPAGTAASLTITTMATPTVPAPDAPTGFSGSTGINTASFTWNAVRGQTYEIRRDGGAWNDATTPYQETGLSPDTTYKWDLRIKASGSTPAGNIASLTIKTMVRPVGPLSIESIDPQFIVVGTKNYVLEIDIGGAPTSVDPTGNMEGFDHTWNADLGKLYIRAVEVERLIVGAIWKITISRGAESLEAEILYNVIPPGLIFHDLDLIHLYKGVPISYHILMDNIPPLVLPTARLLGLKADVIDLGVWVYGQIPADSVFTDATGETFIAAPLDTGEILEKRYPYQIEEGDPPAMTTPTFTPKGNYGELVFPDVQHAIGYEWAFGEINDETVWNDTRPVVNPDDIEVTPGSGEVTLKFPNVPLASSYEYRLDSDTFTREWTRFQGILENGMITVIVPNLPPGQELDLSLRVAGPWVGTPVMIKVSGGRIVVAAYQSNRVNSLVLWNTGTLPLLANDATLQTPQLIKSVLMPSEVSGTITAIAVDSETETAYIVNNSETIYVFGFGSVGNAQRATLDKSFRLPSTTRDVSSLAFFDNRLYIKQQIENAQSGAGYTAYLYNVPADTSDGGRAVGSDYFGHGDLRATSASISVTKDWIYHFFRNPAVMSVYARQPTDYQNARPVSQQNVSVETSASAKRVGDRLYSMDAGNGTISDVNVARANQYLKRWTNPTDGFRDMDVLV